MHKADLKKLIREILLEVEQYPGSSPEKWKGISGLEKEVGKQKVFGSYKWKDPHQGWGFGGWVGFYLARDRKEAEQKINGKAKIGYDILGVEEVNPTKLRSQLEKELKKTTELLKKLNNPIK